MFDIFLIFAQNIDCGYTRRGGSNEYPQKTQFFYIKVGFKGKGLQTLSFISKERDQQNIHFDTTFINMDSVVLKE